MLIKRHRTSAADAAEAGAIHNFYEHLVMDQIASLAKERLGDNDYIADVACVALNHLPPRYVRYDVDMAFYLSPKEQQEMEIKVSRAVKNAILFVDKRGKLGPTQVSQEPKK